MVIVLPLTLQGLLDNVAFQVSVVSVLHSMLVEFFKSIVNSRAIVRARDLKSGSEDARNFLKTLDKLIKAHIRDISKAVPE